MMRALFGTALSLYVGMTTAALTAGCVRDSLAQKSTPSPEGAQPAEHAILPDVEYEPRSISFSGRHWEVKGGRRLGPGPNDFAAAPDCVFIDEQGHLHLRIAERDGRWRCAEIVGTRSLGYGQYDWTFSGGLAALHENTVLGLFIYEDDQHEIDFELARWAGREKQNAQFVVQPWTKSSMHRFDTGSENVITCRLTWLPGRVEGRCWAGKDATGALLAQWDYSGFKVPSPGVERPRANLWLFGGKSPQRMQEVVVHSFGFQPLVSDAAAR